VVQERIRRIDARIEDVAKKDEDMRLLETIPGVDHVAAMTIKADVGEVDRFSFLGRSRLICWTGSGRASIRREGRVYRRYV
jgi:transposase